MCICDVDIILARVLIRRRSIFLDWFSAFFTRCTDQINKYAIFAKYVAKTKKKKEIKNVRSMGVCIICVINWHQPSATILSLLCNLLLKMNGFISMARYASNKKAIKSNAKWCFLSNYVAYSIRIQSHLNLLPSKWCRLSACFAPHFRSRWIYANSIFRHLVTLASLFIGQYRSFSLRPLCFFILFLCFIQSYTSSASALLSTLFICLYWTTGNSMQTLGWWNKVEQQKYIVNTQFIFVW